MVLFYTAFDLRMFLTVENITFYQCNSRHMVSKPFSHYVQAAADAKYYGNTEIYNILKARGAKVPVQNKQNSFLKCN